MTALLLVLIGLLPGACWLLYLRGKDDREPEPWRLTLVAFALGGAAAVATIFLRRPLEDLLPIGDGGGRHLLDAFLLTAPLEETLKAAALLLGVAWHRELDEPLDGIVYGTAVGLGFASVENIVFAQEAGASVVFHRGFTATLTHVATSGTVGFCYGLARLSQSRRAYSLVPLGLLLAVLCHGAYDWFLSVSLAWVALLLVLPLMLAALARKIHWARARSAEYHGPRRDGQR